MKPLVLLAGIAGVCLIGIAVFTLWYFASPRKKAGEDAREARFAEARLILGRWNTIDYLLLFPFAFAILFLAVDLFGAVRDKSLYPSYYAGYLTAGLIFVILTFVFLYLRLILTLRLYRSQPERLAAKNQSDDPTDADHPKQGVERGKKRAEAKLRNQITKGKQQEGEQSGG